MRVRGPVVRVERDTQKAPWLCSLFSDARVPKQKKKKDIFRNSICVWLLLALKIACQSDAGPLGFGKPPGRWNAHPPSSCLLHPPPGVGGLSSAAGAPPPRQLESRTLTGVPAETWLTVITKWQ